MRKKSKITQEELDLFHRAVSGIRRIVSKKIRIPVPQKQQRNTSIRNKHPDFDFKENHRLPPVTSEEFISYTHSSVSSRILRKLRKGLYPIDATLDLHGMSTSSAKLELNQFLQECMDAEKRVVLIVHGKGRMSNQPILKNKLNHWLRQINVVLAFCSAGSRHGSRGAIYVLLKRKSEESFI